MPRALLKSRSPASVGSTPLPLRISSRSFNSTSRLWMPAESGLSHVKEGGRTTETAKFGNADEITQLAYVHRRSSPRDRYAGLLCLIVMQNIWR